MRKPDIPIKAIGKSLFTTAIVALPLTIPSGSGAEGVNASVTVSQRLEYTNEKGVAARDDEGFISRTDLGFALSSETRNQRLSLSANTSLKYNLTNSGGDDRFEFDDPTLRLLYAVESRQTRLSFDAIYQRTDVDNTPFVDEITGEDVFIDDGRREAYGLTSSLVVGRASPTSLSLSHSFRQINYSGTTSTTLVDTNTQTLDGRLTFRLSDVAETYVFASWSERDAATAGSNDRTSEQIGLGGSYDISEVLTATAEISHQKIETDDNAGGVTETDGVSYSFGLSRSLPNGSVSVDFSERETVNGKRRQLSFGHDYEHKRGTLSLSVGLSKTDGLKIAPIVNAAANWNINDRSRLNLNLQQSSTVNNNNESTINSRLGLSYSRTLSEVSSLSASLNLTDRNVRSATGTDQSAVQLNLSHNYEITDDWGLVSGYSYSKTMSDAQADRVNSTIFVGLQRTFSYRP